MGLGTRNKGFKQRKSENLAKLCMFKRAFETNTTVRDVKLPVESSKVQLQRVFLRL